MIRPAPLVNCNAFFAYIISVSPSTNLYYIYIVILYMYCVYIIHMICLFPDMIDMF